MIALIILGHLVVGVVELSLWPEHRLKEVLVYLFLLTGAATLAVLLTLNPYLPVPTPFNALGNLWNTIWQGGGL